MSGVASRERSPAVVAVVGAVDLALALWALTLFIDLRASGRPVDSWPDTVASLTTIVIGVLVGSTVVVRVPRNPVGWVLLAIPSVYAVYGVATFIPTAAGPPWAGVVASLGGPLWIWLLALVGLAFLLVPDGRLPAPRWRWFVPVGTVLVICAYTVLVVTPTGASGGDAGAGQSLALGVLDNTTARVVRGTLAIATFVLVVVAVVSVFWRYRRSDQEVRAQLKWVALSATTVPAFIVGDVVAHLATGGSSRFTDLVLSIGFDVVMLAVTLGMALAVSRYRLYSVDPMVDTVVVWVGASVVVLTVAAGVVIGAGLLVGRGSPVAVALATSVALLAVRPVRRFLQRRVNHRFHRRTYDAVAAVTAYTERLRSGGASLDDLQPVLRRAVGSDLKLLLPLAGSRWCTPSGQMVVPADGVDVRLGDLLVARLVGGDPRVTSAVGEAAVLALDNARLRAEVLAQLTEVRASRQRIVAAQLAERRRLERNLHDGAQQRLVAAALNVGLARSSERPELLDTAVELINHTIKEIREIGRGLHPAALNEEGLTAAIESLTDRLPLPVEVRLDLPDHLPPDAATGAYFVVSEALANALKHADATRIAVRGHAHDGRLSLDVADDGVGGALIRPGGGLSSLRDRIEALGGTLSIAGVAGTVVHVELPCGP